MIGIKFELVVIGRDAAGFPVLNVFDFFAESGRETCAAARAAVATDTASPRRHDSLLVVSFVVDNNCDCDEDGNDDSDVGN